MWKWNQQVVFFILWISCAHSFVVYSCLILVFLHMWHTSFILLRSQIMPVYENTATSGVTTLIYKTAGKMWKMFSSFTEKTSKTLPTSQGPEDFLTLIRYVKRSRYHLYSFALPYPVNSYNVLFCELTFVCWLVFLFVCFVVVCLVLYHMDLGVRHR